MTTRILLVEDDFALRAAISASLEVCGYSVLTAESAEVAMVILAKSNLPDMVITDIQMQAMSGIDLLKHIRKSNTSLPVILMTAYGDISDAVAVMKLGACDYLQKPFEPEKLSALIENYLPKINTQEIVIEDPRSIETFQYARKISLTSSNVLLSGPSGAGKEVMAKYIHQHSNRHDNKFVAINCAAIPENMLESTLFGYEKGAFTGAHQASAGKFEQAQGGTLLLDEISEMPLGLQAKILRVIQEKEVERLGGKKTIELDVRIIATTNRDLVEEVKQKQFRQDLYYRLNVFPIQCLALKQRPKDIIPLAEVLLAKYDRLDNRGTRSFSNESKEKLVSYDWPGNVRELDNLIQRVSVLAGDKTIEATDILFEVQSASNLSVFSATDINGTDLESEMNQLDESRLEENRLGKDMRHHEYQIIIDTLTKCRGKKKDVATKLGISARTLRYKIAKMREFGYSIPDKKSLA